MWILSLFETLNAYRKFRSNLRELSSLDDRLLRDIGIDRTEIVGIAWKQAWR